MNLTYERLFAEKHRVSGLLLYYQQEYARNDAGSNIFAAVPRRNVALSGRATYSYMDKYLAEFNFGYTGSENFEKGKRLVFSLLWLWDGLFLTRLLWLIPDLGWII